MNYTDQSLGKANGYIMGGYTLILVSILYAMNWQSSGTSPYAGLAFFLVLPIVGLFVLLGCCVLFYGLLTFPKHGAKDRLSLIGTFAPLILFVAGALYFQWSNKNTEQVLRDKGVRVNFLGNELAIPIDAPILIKTFDHGNLNFSYDPSKEKLIKFAKRNENLELKSYAIGWFMSGDSHAEQFSLSPPKILTFTNNARLRKQIYGRDLDKLVQSLSGPNLNKEGKLTSVGEQRRNTNHYDYLYRYDHGDNDFDIFRCFGEEDTTELSCYAQVNLGDFWSVHEYESFDAERENVAEKFLEYRAEVFKVWAYIKEKYAVEDAPR